jgi:hypothetical protein
MTQTAGEWLEFEINRRGPKKDNPPQWLKELYAQAKEMEKQQHEKFNNFLNSEKKLGIADLKSIERIQWYYNTYFNETYGGNK